ncbi:hypothetical protein QBC38DRAFT_234036 [Podospora fimiseda]|uniref:Uncharacterized protein n=1 Tax=Podospora fimiseda TaxID=252190 RepID=A0AAN7BN05_9PEZI|nr:hypothetical protein QBC38DRAFT_234036 [Podospora fimiseda]
MHHTCPRLNLKLFFEGFNCSSLSSSGDHFSLYPAMSSNLITLCLITDCGSSGFLGNFSEQHGWKREEGMVFKKPERVTKKDRPSTTKDSFRANQPIVHYQDVFAVRMDIQRTCVDLVVAYKSTSITGQWERPTELNRLRSRCRAEVITSPSDSGIQISNIPRLSFIWEKWRTQETSSGSWTEGDGSPITFDLGSGWKFKVALEVPSWRDRVQSD